MDDSRKKIGLVLILLLLLLLAIGLFTRQNPELGSDA